MNLNASFLNNVFKWPKAAKTSYKLTTDGIRIRTSFWAANEPVGTVFVFPGRADYIEKYGGLANFCLSNNLNVIAIDWRGQGLSARLLDDKNIGHIEDFKNYQHDVEVMIKEAKEANLVRPWIIFAHSMGGLIGLRTLQDLPIFEKVVFTSPMWGIQMPPILKSGALSVRAYITHGVLSNGADKKISNSSLEELVISDSIPYKGSSKKVRQVTVSNLFGEAMRRITNEESVSSLFK